MAFPPPPLPPQVQQALQRGNQIEAIKLLRAATGLGLKEAKQLIDAHVAEGKTGSRLGCGMAMSRTLAGGTPAPEAASHGPGIQPCRHGGNGVLDA